MSAAEGSGLRAWRELPETTIGNRQVGCSERRKVAEKVTPEQGIMRRAREDVVGDEGRRVVH